MNRLLLVSILIIFVFSCQEKKDKQSSSSFDREQNAFYSNLKALGEIASFISATNITFDSSLVSNPQNAIRYRSDNVKAAANLGIYLADMNYCVAYEQSDKTTQFFEAARQLSQVIGIERNVLEFLMNRYRDRIAQRDSVKAIVDSLFARTTADLKGTKNEPLAGIAMGTYEIENLHLLLGIIEHHQNDASTAEHAVLLEPLYKVVLDQHQRVRSIYIFLKSITDPLDPDKNPNLPYYANAFDELIQVYQRGEKQLSENQNSEIVRDAWMKELNEKVNAIRDEVTRPIVDGR